MPRILGFVLVALVAGQSMSRAADPEPAPAPAEESAPDQVPRTHVDSTVVGDSVDDAPNAATSAAGLENDHHFRAGAPELVAITQQLHLTPRQTTQLNAVIEKSDAGAAALIRRDNAVTDMLSSTKPEDPMYQKLVDEHASAPTRWRENRDELRRAVLEVLNPAQRAQFEKLAPTLE